MVGCQPSPTHNFLTLQRTLEPSLQLALQENDVIIKTKKTGRDTLEPGRRDTETGQIFFPEWNFFGQVKTLELSLQLALQKKVGLQTYKRV